MASSRTRHLSVRVPWHDAGWDGTVCQNPKGNSSCLAISLIAADRNDELETSDAGAAFSDLPADRLPPCVRERAGFLSGVETNLPVVMPYSRWSEHHKHIQPTVVPMPGYGGVVVPYRWMLREPASAYAADWGLDLDLDREPQAPMPDFMVKTVWLQDVDNQRAMLDGFAEPLEKGSSLVFFYAKRTPLSEGLSNPIVAVACLEHLGTVDDYPYKGGSADGRFRSMVWERPFQHSLKRSNTIRIFSSALYCLRVALRMSFTTRSAGAFECFAFISVPYSHCNETKTLTYFMQPICLLNADGGQFHFNIRY